MIVSLRGVVLEKTADGAVIEAGGVGYAVVMGPSALERLASPGGEAQVHVAESVAMYGGGTTLYGFSSVEEKRIFAAIRDNVPGVGAKKALELLDKALKSLPDFRRAVWEKDTKTLVSLFGFRAKTAEKLVAGLEGRIEPAGAARAAAPAGVADFEDAVQGLVALGYREPEARQAARRAREELGADAASQAIIRQSLRRLSGRA